MCLERIPLVKHGGNEIRWVRYILISTGSFLLKKEIGKFSLEAQR